eukprot:1710534-Rhodomonas_salina.3
MPVPTPPLALTSMIAISRNCSNAKMSRVRSTKPRALTPEPRQNRNATWHSLICMHRRMCGEQGQRLSKQAEAHLRPEEPDLAEGKTVLLAQSVIGG